MAPLNEHIVQELKNRMDANMAAVSPDELMKSWMSFGGQATEQVRKLMTAAATSAQTFKPGG